MNIDAIIQQYGPQGLMIGALLLACRHLWAKLAECQEKRIAELRETLVVMAASTAAAQAVAAGLAALKVAIEQRSQGGHGS